MEFLFVCLVAVILVGLGWPLVIRLDRKALFNAGERLIFSYLVGGFILYLGVFAVGLYRLDAISMWGLLGVGGICALPGLRQIPWASFVSAAQLEIRYVRENKWCGLLWLTVFAIGLSSLIQGMAPPNDYDSLMYHLAQPQFDLEMGRISVAWDRMIGTELFPALAGNLSRLALAVAGDGAAQMLHGMLGLVAGLSAALFVLRLGYGRSVALAAAIFFLATRVVIWEMASVEVDVALAAYAMAAIIAYSVLRDNSSFGLALLFGLMVGCGILVKYHGFIVAAAFAPIILFDLGRRRLSLTLAVLGPLVALMSMAPHMVRNYTITENPIFPLFNTIFNPDKHNFFVPAQQYVEGNYGTGKGLIDLLITPWNMFVFPMHVFDGMIFGAPYLFVLAPLLLLEPKQLKKWLPALSVAAVYFLGWFYLLGLQVRFLTPIIPVMSAAAAAGAVVLWGYVGHSKILKMAFLGISLVLVMNQALFVGVYSIIRLPSAVGLMSPSAYHSNTPTMTGAMYETCTYIRNNLKAGEKYFSILQPHSYYCPQASVVRAYFPDEAQWWNEEGGRPAELPLAEFIKRSEEMSFKYFASRVRNYNRRNETAKMNITKADLSTSRFGQYLRPVFDTLTPLVEDDFTAVFDGPQVIAGLKKLLADQNK